MESIPIEASCVSVPIWTFQPRFKYPTPPQSRLGLLQGHCRWGLSLPFQLLYFQAEGKKELRCPLTWPYDLVCPMKSEQLWHVSFTVGALGAGAGPAVCPFPSAAGSLQCVKWEVRAVMFSSLRCGAPMLLQQYWGCPDSDTVTGIWAIPSVYWWPWTMNPRAGTRVRSEAFTTDSRT